MKNGYSLNTLRLYERAVGYMSIVRSFSPEGDRDVNCDVHNVGGNQLLTLNVDAVCDDSVPEDLKAAWKAHIAATLQFDAMMEKYDMTPKNA